MVGVGPIAIVVEAGVQAGLGLAGRRLCCRVWGLCFRVGRSVLGVAGLRSKLVAGPVAVVFASFVQAGSGLAGRGLCGRVWGLCFRVGRSVLGVAGL